MYMGSSYRTHKPTHKERAQQAVVVIRAARSVEEVGLGCIYSVQAPYTPDVVAQDAGGK